MTGPQHTTPLPGPAAGNHLAGKHALVERERRFLLAAPPLTSQAVTTRRITDRYLTGTRLRLRRDEYVNRGVCQFKLTQKVPSGQPGPVRGLITSIVLSRAEYGLLASLPAELLCRTRLSVPPLGVDLFDPPLSGLVLGEAEFATDETAEAFVPPPSAVAEVTDDERFTGGSLVRAQRDEVLGWLAEYGIAP